MPIGVDVEVVGARDAQIAARILTENEQRRVGKLAPEARAKAVVVHFSLKEAFIKDLYPGEVDKLYPYLSGSSGDLKRRERIIGFHQIEPSDDKAVLFLTVNSAAAITGANKNTPVHIRKDVFDAIEKQLRSTPAPIDNEREELRILVVHHHLLPFYELNWGKTASLHAPPDKPDGTVIANSADLQNWLATNHFRIALHGHKHVPHGREDILYRRDDPARPLVVIGAGSCGVFSKERAGESLSYHRIDMGADRPRSRSHPDGGERSWFVLLNPDALS